jgi:hypothetical protein
MYLKLSEKLGEGSSRIIQNPNFLRIDPEVSKKINNSSRLPGLCLRQVLGRGHGIEEWEAVASNDVLMNIADEHLGNVGNPIMWGFNHQGIGDLLEFNGVSWDITNQQYDINPIRRSY